MSGKRESQKRPPKYMATEMSPTIRAAARALAKQEIGPTGHEGQGGKNKLNRYYPPPPHRQCHAHHCSGNGERCRRWSMPGSRFCNRHRGKQDCYIGKWLAGGEHPGTIIPGTKSLTEEARVFYTQVLSNTLEERLKDVLQLAQDEQISLYEDLALARETVAATVELFSVADTNHMEKGTEQSLQHKIAAGQIMREAQKDLLAICEAIGKQEERRANRTGVSVAAIAFIARQLTAAAAQIYGDDLDKAREFERIAKSIRLPGSAAEIVGTLIEPGEDVLAMDATVPREESGEYNED